MQSISDKIGSLPLLGEVWNHGPLWTFLFLFFIDFGIIIMLMIAESTGPNSSASPPWQRGQYKSFLLGDTLGLPIAGLFAALILRTAPSMEGKFFAQTWWHVLVLIVGIGTSILLEVNAVKSGQYTMSQEFSPSKIWHTIIFGFMAYWVVTALVPVIYLICVDKAPLGFSALAILGVLVWAVTGILDGKLPQPWDAHVEGSWRNWDWHVRPK